mgnify:CR=1 FL=1
MPETFDSNSAIDLVIPFRNEAEYLPGLFQAIEELESSPDDRYFFVDDDSNDNSHLFVKENAFIRLIRLNNQQSKGKKDALFAGIQAGTNPFILTSDADCRPGKKWLHAMRAPVNSDTRMLIGPVLMQNSPGFLAWLQGTESVVLLWVSRFTVRNGFPMLCSGANLLFSRTEFYAVGAYREHQHRSSGDDVLLLSSFLKKGIKGIAFVDSPEACVISYPVKGWEMWFSQRLRWIGKTGHIRAPSQMAFSLILLLQLFLPWLILPVFWPLAVLIPFLEYPIFLKTAFRYRRNFFIGDWFFFRYLYPIAVLALLPAGFLIRKTWKERPLR